MITPVFQVPSLQKSLSGCNWAPVQHSQVQIRIVHRLLYTVNSCGWSPLCGLYSHGLRQQTTQAALSVQTLLFYDTDTTNSHWNTLTENTSLPDISQPLKTIYFVCRIIKLKSFHSQHLSLKEMYPAMLRLLIKRHKWLLLSYDFLHELIYWKADATTDVSGCANCRVVKANHSVCWQINPPLSTLNPSESSVVSYYDVLRMAGRLSNPDINLVHLKSKNSLISGQHVLCCFTHLQCGRPLSWSLFVNTDSLSVYGQILVV